MSDLIARLRTAIGEDERLALPVSHGGNWNVTITGDPGWGIEGDRRMVAHIARHDPARVLAMVAAHREILELHDGSHECSVFDHNGDVDSCAWVPKGGVCSTLRALAKGYGIEAER